MNKRVLSEKTNNVDILKTYSVTIVVLEI